MIDAVAVVEDEVRELVRRRGLDPVKEPVVMRRLVEEAVADYDERSLSGGLPALTDPASATRAVLDAVAAVAIANALVHECDEDSACAVSTLDEQYVADLGLTGNVAGWREVAAEVVAAS